jgi:ATP-dependent DNA helicase RecQ
VLRGERALELRRDPGRAKRAKKQRSKPPETLEDAADQDLFEALRAHRLEVARAQNVPPFVIFHDSTLREMAQARPRTAKEFLALSGIGATKLERYGADFLALIAGEGVD